MFSKRVNIGIMFLKFSLREHPDVKKNKATEKATVRSKD